MFRLATPSCHYAASAVSRALSFFSASQAGDVQVGELMDELREAGKLAKGARQPGTSRGATRGDAASTLE